MAKIQLQKFEIQLNGNRKVYYNNNQINGICLIELNGELDLKQLKIRLNGEALAKWSERESIVQKRAETYQHKFICLALNYDLITNAKEKVITRGIHQIPFTFQLPNYLPNSFEGSYGHIRYWIEAEISKPIFSINYKAKEIIFMFTTLKVSTTIPLSYNKTKSYYSCFVKTGSITYTTSTPKTHYNRGDSIPISFDIKNKTNSSLGIEATLIERHVYRANRHMTVENHQRITVNGPIISRSTEVEDVIQIPIPVNTRLSVKCPVIDVEYYVHFYINDNDSGVMLDFPVIIIDQSIH